MKTFYCITHKQVFEGYNKCLECHRLDYNIGNYIEVTQGEALIIKKLDKIMEVKPQPQVESDKQDEIQ